MERHQENQQKEKEDFSSAKLAVLMPQFGALLRDQVLTEALFDLDTAVKMLQTFQIKNDEVLKALQKKRRKLKETEEEVVREATERALREQKEARGKEASSSGSSSGSEGSDDDVRRKRKDKKGKKKGKKERRDKDKKKVSRHGKDKKKDKPKELTTSENFGRYGLLREVDASTKRDEFMLWAMDVRKINVETMPRPEEKEVFKDYMEDYNTGTLPHRKYYNLELYERERMAKQMAKGMKAGDKQLKPVVDDEKAMLQQRDEANRKAAEERLKLRYAELKGTGKAELMREQELLRLEMQNAYKIGDKRRAQQISNRLMTDDERKAKGLRVV